MSLALLEMTSEARGEGNSMEPRRKKFEELADARAERATIIDHSPRSTSTSIYRETDLSSYDQGYFLSIYKQTEGRWEVLYDDGSFQSSEPPRIDALDVTQEPLADDF